MTRLQRVSWFLVVLVTLVMGAVVAPMAPSWGPSTRSLAVDTELSLNTATVTIPAGWDVDIAGASQSQPSASLGDVEVATTDAIWLGSSARLLEHVAGLAFSTEPDVPDVPEGAKGDEREVWTMTPSPGTPDDDPQRVVVVRQQESVVLVIVRGPADAVAQESTAIDAIVASVSLDAVALDVDVAS